MNIGDYETVAHLVKVKERIERAIKQCDDYDHDEEADCGGVDGAEYGYSGAFCRHSDGSGELVDMTGCYVERESVAAIQVVLTAKLAEIVKRLINFGVDFE